MTQQVKHALAGVRVLEIAQFFAGPMVGRMMVDLGAEVIKLERAPLGDLIRQGQGDPGFIWWNRGKQSICVNIQSPEGSALVHVLVRHVDVVIENFSPGVLPKYGLGYETLREVNPRLIMCSISGFGQTGPYSRRPGNDTVSQAMSGLTYLTGYPDRPPCYTGIYIADQSGGVNGLAAILAALYYREKTGIGQYIDLSLVECLFHLHDTPLKGYIFSHGEFNPERSGSHRNETVPCGIFKANGGYIVMTVMPHQWERFVGVLNIPDLLYDPRFADYDMRTENRFALIEIIENWLQGFPSMAEPLQLFEDNHILAAPVQSLAEVVNDPHMKARGAMQECHYPEFGNVLLPKLPFHFSETPVGFDPRTPMMGEDNAAVLGRHLGLSEGKIQAFMDSGVLAEDPRVGQARRRGKQS
jgi:crotonobetainyl-CoA:carnitine CoA-transferase CaiB-like acyl-CoA transferase